MDDTWVIQQQSRKQEFLEHINQVDPAIKFTVEGTQGNGAIPFLDTLVTLQADGSPSITVYQKPTHTDQYLQWDSHHSLSAKYSVLCELCELFQRQLAYLGHVISAKGIATDEGKIKAMRDWPTPTTVMEV